MKGDKTAADGQLRFGWNESGSSSWFFAPAENAGDSVGLCKESGVNDAEAEADGRLLDATNDVGRLDYKEERDGVAEEDAAE